MRIRQFFALACGCVVTATFFTSAVYADDHDFSDSFGPSYWAQLTPSCASPTDAAVAVDAKTQRFLAAAAGRVGVVAAQQSPLLLKSSLARLTPVPNLAAGNQPAWPSVQFGHRGDYRVLALRRTGHAANEFLVVTDGQRTSMTAPLAALSLPIWLTGTALVDAKGSSLDAVSVSSGIEQGTTPILQKVVWKEVPEHWFAEDADGAKLLTNAAGTLLTRVSCDALNLLGGVTARQQFVEVQLHFTNRSTEASVIQAAQAAASSNGSSTAIPGSLPLLTVVSFLFPRSTIDASELADVARTQATTSAAGCLSSPAPGQSSAYLPRPVHVLSRPFSNLLDVPTAAEVASVPHNAKETDSEQALRASDALVELDLSFIESFRPITRLTEGALPTTTLRTVVASGDGGSPAAATGGGNSVAWHYVGSATSPPCQAASWFILYDPALSPIAHGVQSRDLMLRQLHNAGVNVSALGASLSDVAETSLTKSTSILATLDAAKVACAGGVGSSQMDSVATFLRPRTAAQEIAMSRFSRPPVDVGAPSGSVVMMPALVNPNGSPVGFGSFGGDAATGVPAGALRLLNPAAPFVFGNRSQQAAIDLDFHFRDGALAALQGVAISFLCVFALVGVLLPVYPRVFSTSNRSLWCPADKKRGGSSEDDEADVRESSAHDDSEESGRPRRDKNRRRGEPEFPFVFGSCVSDDDGDDSSADDEGDDDEEATESSEGGGATPDGTGGGSDGEGSIKSE